MKGNAMKSHQKIIAIISALLAAVFYALNAPVSKLLLEGISPTMMAGLLYLGAGIGIGLLSLMKKAFHSATPEPESQGTAQEKLAKADLPYVIGMVLLDIAAPVLLMFGLTLTNAANAALLNNFEIVATTLIALCLFGEKVSWRLWVGIVLITISSILLSMESAEGLSFSGTSSLGSLLVLAATVCWGFENNCTRKISSKSTYEIVFIKGIFSGLGSVVLARIIGEEFPAVSYLLPALLLGFVAYGLSIFFYIRAQAVIGAAKTSAYYAVAPFIGALLSFLILHESLSGHYLLALFIMILGSAAVVLDTLVTQHTHVHRHVITHTHDGSTHTHVIEHTHTHSHLFGEETHEHKHLHYEHTHEAS